PTSRAVWPDLACTVGRALRIRASSGGLVGFNGISGGSGGEGNCNACSIDDAGRRRHYRSALDNFLVREVARTSKYPTRSNDFARGPDRPRPPLTKNNWIVSSV